MRSITTTSISRLSRTLAAADTGIRVMGNENTGYALKIGEGTDVRIKHGSGLKIEPSGLPTHVAYPFGGIKPSQSMEPIGKPPQTIFQA